jgi:hypothetical protein
MTAAEESSAPSQLPSPPSEPPASASHSNSKVQSPPPSPPSAVRPPSDLAFLISAFTAFDVSFQQQQNDDTITAFAATCQQLCHRQQEREREKAEGERSLSSAGGLTQCLRDCSVQILESFAHLEQRLEAQQAEIQRRAADEEVEDDEDDDDEEDEVEEEEEEDGVEQTDLQEETEETDAQS